MIELGEVDAKSDIWVRCQEIVHLTDAAVISFVTRGVVGIQDDVPDAIVVVYGPVKITVRLKQHGFRMGVVRSAAARVALLHQAPSRSLQFIKREVFCLRIGWSIGESKNLIKFCVGNSCFFTCPDMVRAIRAI